MCFLKTLMVVSKAAMWFVALRLADMPCHADEQSAEQGRIPPAAIERLSIVVTEKAPDVKITVDEFGRCRFVERCDQYLVHGVKGKLRTHGFGKKSRVASGPSADGFLLQLNWMANLDGGAGGTGWGPMSPENYWRQYHNSYKLPNDQGFIVMRWQYSADTDMTILAAVRTELATFGEPVYDVEREAWDGKSARLRERLTDVLKKYHSEAQWRTDEKCLVCEFNTMEFDVHAIDEQDHVSPEAHKETGPDRDGFIIRLTPRQVALRGQSRSMCGVSYGPYWHHYFANCDEYSLPFRLDILYGEFADKKLLKEVTETLNGQIGVFQSF